MRPRAPIHTDIVLLGAGPAHLEVLRRFAQRPEPGVRLTLVSREPEEPDARMLPGLIRGDYSFEQAHIDLGPLAAGAGARLILGEATAINLTERRLAVTERPEVPFDLLSINLDGTSAAANGAGHPVSPIGEFLERLAAVEAQLPPGSRIAVVGSDASGTELALALARRYGERARIVLINHGAEPLADAPSYARRAARAALVDAGVGIVNNVRAGALVDGRLSLSDGSFLDVATVLWATKGAGPKLLAASGLACDRAGRVRVDAALRSVSHGCVFAAADSAGAALAANLRRAARGRALHHWRPRRGGVALVGLGHGSALSWWRGIAVSGRLVWHWKDWADRRRMRLYQEPQPPAQIDEAAHRGPSSLASADVMLPPPGMAMAQSVRHLLACIDDPFVFSEIAAAHALSAVHAMGARPWTALTFATVPAMSGDKMQVELRDMLEGASRALIADGCTLIGGQSSEASELALGIAVTGLAEPTKLLRKSGLRPGDALVLTKPLGTGIVLAGHRRGLARAAWLQAALASMRLSNATASRLLVAHGAVACTDIVGLGLTGHLSEMLRASGVGAAVWADRVPALPGALVLAENGGADARAALLVDPQTSGGLLAGISPKRAEACVAALRDAGLPAAIIGVVESGEPAIRLEDA